MSSFLEKAQAAASNLMGGGSNTDSNSNTTNTSTTNTQNPSQAQSGVLGPGTDQSSTGLNNGLQGTPQAGAVPVSGATVTNPYGTYIQQGEGVVNKKYGDNANFMKAEQAFNQYEGISTAPTGSTTTTTSQTTTPATTTAGGPTADTTANSSN